MLARTSWAGLRLVLAATVVLGLLYPLAMTGIAQVAAPWRSQGSLVTATGEHTTDAGQAVGSELIGQATTDAARFFPRPSAAGDGWDGLASAGSNLGPESPDLVAAIEERLAEVADREGVDPSEVPPDAVTASASGLDPDISPAYAELQVPRVARETGLSEDDVRELVDEHTAGRGLGVLGEPHVRVLTLNLALDAAVAQATSSGGPDAG